MARPRSELAILVGLALLHFCPVASGQAEPIDLSFRVLSVGAGAFDGIHCQPEPGEVEELSFSRFLPSAPLRYRGPAGIIFFRLELSPTGEPRRIPVARVEVPQGVERCLFFFRKGDDGALPYAIDWIDDSPGAFPLDSMVLLNATGRNLIARVGNEELALPPGSSPAIPFGKIRNREIPVKLAISTASGAKLAFGNTIDAGSGGRVVLVLEAPRRAGSLRIRTYAIIEREPLPSSP